MTLKRLQDFGFEAFLLGSLHKQDIRCTLFMASAQQKEKGAVGRTRGRQRRPAS